MNKCKKYYYVLALFLAADKMPRMGHSLRIRGKLCIFIFYTYDGWGNVLTTGGLTGSVSVGSRQLVVNSYNPGTWTLSGQSYGNGQSWSYTYNNAGQITSRSDGTNTWRYYYNSEGALGRVERYSGQTKTGALRNYYDSADRLIRVVEQDGSGAVVHEYAWTYDSNDKVASLTETVNGESFSYTYGYNGDMAALNMSGTATRSYTYDGYGRLSRTVTDNILTTDYAYRTVNAGGTDYATTQIAAVQNTYGGASRSLNYTYDNNGNILTVSDGTNTTSYSYDAQGQLVWEYNEGAGKAWQYTYDSGGNILSRTEYAYTTGSPGTALSSASYTYGDTGWGDLLTAYNGQAITYDGIGNMTSYGGWSLGWSGGRRLSTMSRDGTSLLFAYNDEGQRTEKTVNGSTHKYLYRGGLLIADICGNDALYFRYDQNGEVIGFLRTLGVNRAEYRYVKNQQGDVVAVIDFAGAEAATYTYDGWGNVLTTGGYDANLAARNPLRYRGYYYDSETELYYVTSRYYNPEMGRFICADGYATTYNSAAGANMFAYCLNSTILFRDDQGTRRVMVDVGVETYGPNGRATANLHAELTGEEDKTWIVSGGVEAGISFGLRFSISFQYVWDSEKGIDVVTTFFIGAGTPNAYIGGKVSVARGKSIDDLAGAAWDVGGGSTRLLGLGVDIQDGGGTLSASKSLFPYEMHGGVALTTVTSATDLLYIQDDMAKYGGGMYQ